MLQRCTSGLVRARRVCNVAAVSRQVRKASEKRKYDIEQDSWMHYNNFPRQSHSMFDGGFSLGSALFGFVLGAGVVYYYWKFVDDTAEFSLGGDDEEEEGGESKGEGGDDKKEESAAGEANVEASEEAKKEEAESSGVALFDPTRMNEKIEVFRKRFAEYAKIEKNGEKFMDQEQFIASLLPPGPSKLPFWAAYPKIIQKFRGLTGSSSSSAAPSDSFLTMLFQLADTNKDNLISFSEYAFFLTLLSYSPRQYRNAFKHFDKDNSGTISLNEFKHVLVPSSDIGSDIPIMKQWFGEDGNKQLSFDDFSKFIESLRLELLKREFDMYDLENRGMISVEAFHQLLTSNTHLNSIHVPEFKRHLNILKTNGFFKPSGRVSFDMFAAFHKLSEQIDDLADAIQALTAGGKPLNKANFSSAVHEYAGIDLSPKETDLIFAIFDRNGDGTIEYDEFKSVLQSRSDRSHAYQQEPVVATSAAVSVAKKQ